jgi:hypothetical protein
MKLSLSLQQMEKRSRRASKRRVGGGVATVRFDICVRPWGIFIALERTERRKEREKKGEHCSVLDSQFTNTPLPWWVTLLPHLRHLFLGVFLPHFCRLFRDSFWHHHRLLLRFLGPGCSTFLFRESHSPAIYKGINQEQIWQTLWGYLLIPL